MNASIPVVECYVRLSFMNQEDENITDIIECQIFGMTSIPGQTPLFHFICDDGAIFWRMPIHAFCHKKNAPKKQLADLVLWDSFSYNINITCFDLLKNKKISYADRSKNIECGQYLFTIDWFGDKYFNGFAETPGQHKCGHFLALDNGNFAIQPNNRIRIFDPNFVTKDSLYPRKIANKLYSSEHTSKWRTEDSDEYLYSIKTNFTENKNDIN